MKSLQTTMEAYKQQLEIGDIQQAYRGLMAYMGELRIHFQKAFPGVEISGSVYPGYMDMTYFALVPASLKPRKLKIAIVFLHEAWRFEVWLSGANRQVQASYWELLRESGWGNYRLVADPLKADGILEHTLVEKPDFSNAQTLTNLIEHGTCAFIEDVEHLLAPIAPSG